MHMIQALISQERGMVLYVSLLILAILMLAGLGAVLSVQNDLKITANLRSATDVFYLSEAGIEWGKAQVSASVANPVAPVGESRSFSNGNFSVSFVSPTRVNALVSSVIIRSTGIARGSSLVIQAKVTKSYDLSDAAVALRGNGRNMSFSGSSFFISGKEHDPTSGNVLSDAEAHPAISVSSPELRDRIEESLTDLQRTNLTGLDPKLSPVLQSDMLSESSLTRLASDLCAARHAVVIAMPTDATLSFSGQLWGTRSSPQLRCINGLAGSGDSVTVGGDFSGAGILVVRNAELIANGSFHWEGLVIVTGENVGFKVSGEEPKVLYGSLVINENQLLMGGPKMLDVQGAIRIVYSRAALGSASSLVPTAALDRVYGSLPSTIAQNYWRTVTP